MEIETAAKILAELGNPVRLKVVRLLVQAGRDGVSVGRIQDTLKIPASTLSHHLKHLKSVGLIIQRREQTTLWCVMDYNLLEGVMGFLTDECCFGLPSENTKKNLITAVAV
ncbi:MAG: helix-turn-helix transcriptional regulator [SAR324 cluster bacterium]|nr:helix-turn-helix transcriptional regulator [SAR324 cluster bacterium]MBL7035861.1 helix-turn-helix transcriptional regulator [SAR324 cluster bacterium]